MPTATPDYRNVFMWDASKNSEGSFDGIAQQIDEIFTYSDWDDEQKHAGNEVRSTLSDAFKAIVAHVPPCPSRTTALQHLIDARMRANQAITFRGGL